MTFCGWSTQNRDRLTIAVIGIGQIISWGTTYYLPAILAKPIMRDTGWGEQAVIAMFSVALLASGVVAPSVGRLIQRHGGASIMAAGVALNALGLTIMASASVYAAYAFAWIVIGVGMAASLYTAAFATISQIIPLQARRAITNITLWGGFASTVFWPFGGLLLAHGTWRTVCIIYALILLFIVLPAYLILLPRARSGHVRAEAADVAQARAPQPVPHPRTFAAFAGIIVFSAFVSASLSVFMIILLRNRGLDLTSATAVAALLGPAQVAARFCARAVAEKHHPLWILLVAVVLTGLGLGLLFGPSAWLAVSVIVYGAGQGLISIARGTVPLALFGTASYPLTVARLDRPALIMQACAPFLASLLYAALGLPGLLSVVLTATLITVPVTLWLLSQQRRDARA